jgi:hypothetical protein
MRYHYNIRCRATQPTEAIQAALEDFLVRNGPDAAPTNPDASSREQANGAVFASSVIQYAAVKPRCAVGQMVYLFLQNPRRAD